MIHRDLLPLSRSLRARRRARESAVADTDRRRMKGTRMRATLCSALILAAAVVFAAPVVADAPVSGTYRANGKDAKLAYAVAVKHEPFSGKEAVTIVFTEKDPSTEKKPDITASFGKLGNALIVTITKDGSVIGCEVAHTALKHMGASTIGRLKLQDLKWQGPVLKGRLTTGGPVDLFDEKWEADLTFDVKAPS
jgi:hypothetical protein